MYLEKLVNKYLEIKFACILRNYIFKYKIFDRNKILASKLELRFRIS